MPELQVLQEKDMGDPTYFLGGKYHGQEGWINKNKEKTACYTYVLVYVKTKGRDHLGYKTRVLHEYVGDSIPPEKAASAEEQVLIDYPDVDKLLCQVAMALVKHDISPQSDIITTIFVNKMVFMKKKLDTKRKKNKRSNRLPKIGENKKK